MKFVNYPLSTKKQELNINQMEIGENLPPAFHPEPTARQVGSLFWFIDVFYGDLNKWRSYFYRHCSKLCVVFRHPGLRAGIQVRAFWEKTIRETEMPGKRFFPLRWDDTVRSTITWIPDRVRDDGTLVYGPHQTVQRYDLKLPIQNVEDPFFLYIRSVRGSLTLLDA